MRVLKDVLIVILRNDGYRKDAGKLAQKAFSDISKGGGHKQMARAEIPMSNVIANNDLENYILNRILKDMGIKKVSRIV